MRLLPRGWQLFRNSRDLAQIVTVDLIDLLNHPTNRYGLSVTELELLATHRRRLRQLATPHLTEPGGAEGGGVLLDLGHREPLDGVALDER
ncbi:MAG: hypothetical protein R2932_25405 [Caldilineaceae bacterium]